MTAIEKYEACAVMLTEMLAQYIPAEPGLFKPAPSRDPRQTAIYAAARGLAESVIGFAVFSEYPDGDINIEDVREQAQSPQWVSEQPRALLASLFNVNKTPFDDGR